MTQLIPAHEDPHALRPAALWLRYDARGDGWTPGRKAAFIAHLADNGIVADAAKAAGKSEAGAYALRRSTRGYLFDLGWEAALLIARRRIMDGLVARAIGGEKSVWERGEQQTVFTRFNSRLGLALIDRINPAASLNEVIAVATRLDIFVDLIDRNACRDVFWNFFAYGLAIDDRDARRRVRANLQLCEECEGFGPGVNDEEAPVSTDDV